MKENGAGLSGSNRNSNSVRNLYTRIARTISSISFESLQEDLSKQKISLQSKCEQGAVLGNALLEHAIKDEKLNVIKFLLQNEVTIINAISQEGRHYISKIEEDKSILCSVVHYTDNSNAVILSTLLRNINAEQSKLNHEDELYILYQQLKDDAFCTAIAENNSVAATVLIQNDQETRASAVNKDETHVVTTPTIVTGKTNTTVPSIEKNRAKPCSSNGNIGSSVAIVPPVSTNGDNHNNENKTLVVTEEINNGQAAMPRNERETKYKESKENFYTSLTKDAVGVVITGLFIAAAVMVPFAAGAAICGIVAALVAVCTGLHIKNSTLPSYREMEENKVEHVSSYMQEV